jgi:hypothetical protein
MKMDRQPAACPINVADGWPLLWWAYFKIVGHSNRRSCFHTGRGHYPDKCGMETTPTKTLPTIMKYTRCGCLLCRDREFYDNEFELKLLLT